MAESKTLDLGNVNHTCSDSSDSEITKAKIIRKFKRKLMERKQLSDSESDSEILRKKMYHDPNLPKYYPDNSIQNQQGVVGLNGDFNDFSTDEQNTYVCLQCTVHIIYICL